MRGLILFVILGLLSFSSLAQKKGKAKLIVYGQGEAAMASAVQASNSGVQVLWINPENSFKSVLTEGTEIKRVSSYANIDAGLWAEFLRRSISAREYSDSVFNRAKSHLSPRISMNTFEKMIDSSANLTVLNKTNIKKISKSGKRWNVELSNGDKHKVFAVVDASINAQLRNLVNEKEKLAKAERDTINLIPIQQIYNSEVYRTSLFIDDRERELIVPAAAIIKPYANNFFVLYGPEGVLADLVDTEENVPTRMLYGQALGAVASYCAFFEINYDKINIRTLQGELLAYRARLLPFYDVAFEDVHSGVIQRTALSGLLKGKINDSTDTSGKLIFDVNSHVSSHEIEPIMRSLYTRSQIWFANKSIEQLKLKDLLSLIKFVALKGNELDASVEKGWSQKFNFSGEYDPECFITRRHVAVLIDTYLQPFNIKVDNKGNFVY